MKFNEKKTTQAASRFLSLADKQMNYMKLIKLLYLMDREALLRWGRPVTGATYYSMKLGPVLSEVRDLIIDQPCPGEEGFWATHISAPSAYEITLLQDAGHGELSEAEEALIDEVYKRFADYDPFELVLHLHETLPEWKRIIEGRIPLTYADILEAEKKSPEEISAIQSELDHLQLMRSLFSAH